MIGNYTENLRSAWQLINENVISRKFEEDAHLII